MANKYKLGTQAGVDLLNKVKRTGNSEKLSDGTTLSLGDKGNVYAFRNGQKLGTQVTMPGYASNGAKVWQVGANGKAPDQMDVGDYVVTGGGTYRKDKNGQGVLTNAATNKYNYTGGYYQPPAAPSMPAPVAAGTEKTPSEQEQLIATIRSYLGNMGGEQYGGSWGDTEYQRLIRQALGMDYNDWTQGDEYKALEDRYSHAGQLAMQDTLGDISARTGGLASSYATSAAAQQYNEYMRLLEDAARQQFAGKRSDVIQNAGLAQGVGEQAYGRWLDEMSRKDAARNADLGLLQYLYGAAVDADNTAYNRAYQARRDAVGDERYEREWQHDLDNEAYQRAEDSAAAMAKVGDYSGYAELWDMTPEQVQMLTDAYAAATNASQQAAARDLADWYAGHGDFRILEQMGVDTTNDRAMYAADLAKAQKSGTASSGRRSSGGSGKPKLTAAQTRQAIKDGIVTDEVREAYQYWFGEDYADDAEDDYGDGYVGEDVNLGVILEEARRIIAREGKTEDARGSTLMDYLDGLIDDGTITEDQADLILERLGL